MSGAFNFPVTGGSEAGTSSTQHQQQTVAVSSSTASFNHQVSEDEGSFTIGGSEPYTPQPVKRGGVDLAIDKTPSASERVTSPSTSTSDYTDALDRDR